MALLGLDFGEKRIGMAVSDGLFITAQVAGKIEYEGERGWEEPLKAAVQKYSAHKIVVGLPIRMDGKDTAQTTKTREFIENVKAIVSIPVDSYDERFTSVSAQRTLISAGVNRKKRKQVIDGLAAQIMLQTYMNSGKR